MPIPSASHMANKILEGYLQRGDRAASKRKGGESPICVPCANSLINQRQMVGYIQKSYEDS